MQKRIKKNTRNLKRITNLIVGKFKHSYKRTFVLAEKKPLLSFFTLLGAVVLLIIASNFIFKGKPSTTSETTTVKSISVYRIGSAPKISVSAQTRKSGVIEITALTGGVIDSIHVTEGASVNVGTTLISMSSNYKGENAFSVQRQLADRQYQTNAATYKTQKEVIDRQIELAESLNENDEELRKITEKSISETEELISQNEEILKILEDQIKTLEENNAPQDQILAAKAQKSQFLAATNQARSGLRNNEYQVSGNNPPAEISDLTKEITTKQLEVQKKQLGLALDVSRLQARVAQINENLMFPSSPFNGTVQRVLVKEKQQVTPGTPLLVISQVAGDKPVTAVAFVSADIAKRLSRFESSTLHIGEKATYTSVPSFVSTEAVQGTLYAVYYPIPVQYHELVVSAGFITIDIPIGYADTTMVATFIPLDSVYQTRENAYVFVIEGDKVKTRTIALGYVYGRFVEVISGLKNGDSIILNRNIIEGDTVKVE